jgi:hypothetical protein
MKYLFIFLLTISNSFGCTVFGTSGVQSGTFKGVSLYSPDSNLLGTVTASGAVYHVYRGYLGYRVGSILYRANNGETGYISGSSVFTFSQALVGRGISCDDNQLGAAALLLWL